MNRPINYNPELSAKSEEAYEKKKREGWDELKDLENEVAEIEMWLCLQKSETDAKRYKILEVLNKLNKLRERMKCEQKTRST